MNEGMEKCTNQSINYRMPSKTRIVLFNTQSSSGLPQQHFLYFFYYTGIISRRRLTMVGGGRGIADSILVQVLYLYLLLIAHGTCRRNMTVSVLKYLSTSTLGTMRKAWYALQTVARSFEAPATVLVKSYFLYYQVQ